jgi:hypothetical protein
MITENELIEIEEEDFPQSSDSDEKTAAWSEEFVMAGQELFETVMTLVHETNIRRIVIKNENKSIDLEIPLLIGVAGIALFPAYAALALIVSLAIDCTITVERVEKAPPPMEDVEIAES